PATTALCSRCTASPMRTAWKSTPWPAAACLPLACPAPTSTAEACARSPIGASSPTGATAAAGASRRWPGWTEFSRRCASPSWERLQPRFASDNGRPPTRMPTMSHPIAALANVPGAAARDAATTGFVFNHTMLRIKDPRASLDFYTRVLGFSLVRHNDFPEAEFSLYFLAIVDPADIPGDERERKAWVAGLQGVLELTH